MKFWKAEVRATIENLPRHFAFWIGEPKELRLTVDSMIPKSLSNKGLSKMLPKSRWDKIRIPTYFDYDQKCAICEDEPELGKLHCHEMWSYDNERLTQKLDGFIALCDPCHRVKHGVWLKQLWNGKQAKRPRLSKDLRRWEYLRNWSAAKYEEISCLPECENNHEILKALEKQSKAVMPCEHFLKVNNCSFKTAEKHFKEVAGEWGQRSQRDWHVDYGEYSPHIRKSN